MKQIVYPGAAAFVFALFFELVGSLYMSVSFAGELKGIGGLEAQPNAGLKGANMLNNPGFEQGISGWNIGSCFTIDNSVARSGQASLKFTPSAGCTSVRQPGIKRTAAAYTVRGWVKADLVNTSGKPRITIFDSTHGTFAESSLSGSGGTYEWKKFEVSGSVLPGHINDLIEYRVYTAGITQGNVWFDDLEIVPVTMPLNMFIKYPNFRGLLWEGGDQVIRGEIEASVPPSMVNPLSDFEAEIKISDAVTLNTLGKIVLSSLGASNEFSWNAGKLAAGSEVLLSAKLKLKNGSTVATYPAYRIVKAPASLRAGLNNWIDKDNSLVHGGKPHFVWGVYERMSGVRCTGCFKASTDYYETIRGFDGLSTLDNYKDTKLNTVIYFSPFSGANPGVPDITKDQINPWAEALRSRGSMHLQVVNNYHLSSKYRPYWATGMTDTELWRIIGTKITNDGMLGYYTADEPDLFGRPSITEVFRQYQALKDANRGSITLEVFSKPAPIYDWRDTADVLSVDIYPVGSGARTDDHLAGDVTAPFFARVDFWTTEAVKAVKDSRPVWAVLQLWTQGGKFPVYDDMKKMAWKSVISGAKGILWWGFVSASGMESRWYGPYGANCPQPCDPAAYNDFKRISTEVTALGHIILSPAVDIVSAGDSRIKLTAREGEKGVFYIFATNTSELTLTGVKFKTNGRQVGRVEVYAESRVVAPSGYGWSDHFDPYDVHVYRIGALN